MPVKDAFNLDEDGVERLDMDVVAESKTRTSLAPLTFKKCISIATMIEYYPQLLVTLPAL